MDIIERYEIYKKGLVPRGTSTTLQKFFKTNPTTDQLLYLAQKEREEGSLLGATIIIYLLMGILLGFVIGIAWRITP